MKNAKIDSEDKLNLGIIINQNISDIEINKIISDIKKLPKNEITVGPKKLPSRWKIFKTKIYQFFKF